MRAKETLENQSQILQSILDSMGDGVIVADADGKLMFMNPAAEHIIGHDPQATTHDDLVEQFCAYLPATVTDGKNEEIPLVRAIRGEVFDAAEVLMRHAIAPRAAWLSMTGRPLKDSAGTSRGGVVVFRDTTEQKQTEQRLHYLANYDPLTRLPHRMLFADRLRQSLARAHWQNRLIALLFVDLDRFKAINDSLGHAVGDQLLVTVAERLLSCAREGDTVARLGGDEFALILVDIAQQADVQKVVQKIQTLLPSPVTIEEHEILITSSMGISLYPSDGDDPDTLLKNADTAMYQAKQLGRNRYQYYSADMGVQATERINLENALRRALDRDEFQLHYQPLFDIPSGRIIGMEALLRWTHPELGNITPATFIPLAEDSGLIMPIGAWVLRTACRQNRDWQDAGYTPMRVAVNLSAKQFQQQDMLTVVTQVLEETGLAARYLEVELTESVMQNAEAASGLRALMETGVQIVIDDFGTGYASLSYLKHFPLDKLKIDQSFICGTPHDIDNTAITTAIIAMAHTLRLKVVAEGVETVEQLEFLRGLGCDEAQGYYLGRPLCVTAMTSLLASLAPAMP